MSSRRIVGKNIFANTVGRLWAAVSNIIFVPLYIKLMGGEGYGLIVAYTTLFATLQVLDAGLSSALSRELAVRMSRGSGGGTAFQSSVDLTRTVEIISMASGVFVGLAIVAAAPMIAGKWLMIRPELRGHTMNSIRLIGAIIAVQWPSMAYQGAMMGLQDQVRLNVVRMTTSAIQALGAIWVLREITATTEGFFYWVLAIQLLNTLCLRYLVWSHLREIKNVIPRFHWREVFGVWRFAGGVAAIAFLSAMLTQTDKIVLSKFVPITEFGVYGVAYTVSGVLGLLAQPVLAGMLPRFTQLFDARNFGELRSLYPLGCELIAFFTVPCWVIVAFHSDELMNLWMGGAPERSSVAELLPILSSGSLANALVTLPYGMQIASGWTSLSVLKNIVTTALAIPALLWAIPHFGTLGAAGIWLMINCGYLAAEIPIMHRRLPLGSLRTWYWRAVALPVGLGAAIGIASKYLMPSIQDRLHLLLLLSVWFLIAALTLGICLPGIRQMATKRLMEYRSLR